MFPEARAFVPKPWTGAHSWLDRSGEDAWDALCAITAGPDWFTVPEYLEAYREERGTTPLLASRQMYYLLRLASIQNEPAVERRGHSWKWIVR